MHLATHPQRQPRQQISEDKRARIDPRQACRRVAGCPSYPKLADPRSIRQPRRMSLDLDLDLERTALIILDLQNYGVHPEGYWMSQMPEGVERIAPSIARTVDALEAARAARVATVRGGNASG